MNEWHEEWYGGPAAAGGVPDPVEDAAQDEEPHSGH